MNTRCLRLRALGVRLRQQRQQETALGDAEAAAPAPLSTARSLGPRANAYLSPLLTPSRRHSPTPTAAAAWAVIHSWGRGSYPCHETPGLSGARSRKRLCRRPRCRPVAPRPRPCPAAPMESEVLAMDDIFPEKKNQHIELHHSLYNSAGLEVIQNTGKKQNSARF